MLLAVVVMHICPTAIGTLVLVNEAKMKEKQSHGPDMCISVVVGTLDG
jgi:hypothetical protein